MAKNELNKLLMNAIAQHDEQEVIRLLALGADPNFQLPKEKHQTISDYESQPYSPLRLVIFMISDAMSSEKELEKDANIARALLKQGADALSVMKFAESRYGKINTDMEITLFSSVLKIVQDAENEQKRKL